MAEWDRLVELCSNDLPFFVLEKQIECAYGLCFCCTDLLPSIEIIRLPCCKGTVHTHCVLDSLTTNDQCVYCWQYLDPQDIIDCTPIRMAQLMHCLWLIYMCKIAVRAGDSRRGHGGLK
jgi:hypothetical protein